MNPTKPIYDELTRCIQLFIDHKNYMMELMKTKDLNGCCTKTDQFNILTLYRLLLQTEYSDLYTSDIFVVLIYTYYSLTYNEQTEDWLDITFMKENTSNFPRSKQLYLAITTGKILMADGIDLASHIRQVILGLNRFSYKGGKKGRDKKHTRKKNRKHKKQTFCKKRK